MSAYDPVLGSIVDRCAEIRAQIDSLNNEKINLEAELLASGRDKVDGYLHSVSLSRGLQRKSVDWKAIAAKLAPSHQLVAAHSSLGEPYSVVRYGARKLPS